MDIKKRLDELVEEGRIRVTQMQYPLPEGKWVIANATTDGWLISWPDQPNKATYFVGTADDAVAFIKLEVARRKM